MNGVGSAYLPTRALHRLFFVFSNGAVSPLGSSRCCCSSVTLLPLHPPPPLPLQDGSLTSLFVRLNAIVIAVSVLFCVFGTAIMGLGTLRGMMQSDLDLAGGIEWDGIHSSGENSCFREYRSLFRGSPLT